jgi:hypothetical protein
MKKLTHTLSVLLLLSPLTALAHGEEVLVTLFLEFIVLVILVVGLLTINLNRTGKVIIGGIGILAVALTSVATNSFPYFQYRTIINIAIVVAPLIILTLSYFALRNKFQKD